MNKVFLIGNLSRDPEFKKTPNDISVCTFSIAINRKFANSSGQKEVDYINIVAWRGLADICSKYLQKGSKVAIVGEIQTRSYTDKNNVKKYITEIIADDVEFLNNKNKENTENISALETPQGFTPLDNDEPLPF